MRQTPRHVAGNGKQGGSTTAASVAPHTPPYKKKSGAELTELIRLLEAKWKLGLDIGDVPKSPAQRCPATTVDKVHSHMKFLFYSEKPALHASLATFETSAAVFVHEKRLELLEGLLKSKRSSAQTSLSRARTPVGPNNDSPKTLLSQSRTPQSTGPSRYDNRHDEPKSHAAALDPGSPTDEDTPQSPSLSSRSAQRRNQASSLVSLQPTTKKRPSDSSSNHSGKSPKLTKTSKGKQAVQSFDLSPILFKKPSLNMACSFQAASVMSSANTSFNTTAASSQETAATTNTSFTSLDGANDARDFNWTETRTSSTTMDSLDDSDLIYAVSHAGKGLFELDIQRELLLARSQEQNRESTSAYGPVDFDVLLDVSCELEAKTTSMAMSVTQDSTVPASTKSSFPPQKVSAADISPEKHSPSKVSHDVRNIPTQNFFVPTLPKELELIPYWILFICQRIASWSSISLEDVVRGMNVSTACSDPDTFWTFIEAHPQVSRIKQRDSSRLWQASKRQFDGYTFKGNVVLSLKQIGPVVNLQLLPIQADKSCRLQRMFGSDRFIYLSTPVFKSNSGRFNTEEMQQIRKQWLEWLLAEHSFLGRKWRVFHIEDIKKKKTSRRKDVIHDKRIVLFATEGCGINEPCSIGQMLDRFIPFATNEHQGYCKAFARIDLGLSRTVPTFCFEASQIIRVNDQLATQDQEDVRFNDAALHWDPFPQCTVMNDGCSMVSVGAAREIWQEYKKTTGATGPLPSVFQGRIAGAKGLWMVSGESNSKDPEHLKPWIQISDSQWKFNPPNDSLHHHRRFEMSNYSSMPSPSELHISFISILVDRGVPREVIANLMSASLDSERTKLLDLLPEPVKVYEWVHKNGTKTRTGIETLWQASLPVSLEEKLKFLLESGFSPVKFPYLAKILERFIQTKQLLQESKLRVPLAKSAFLFGIADPYRVLEPGEIQVQFSETFMDEITNEGYRDLKHDTKLLVARQPACRRSDIQKVRAVIHPQLSHLVDVVIFPSKGRYPLAGKLQGGDYDGDMFWLCWQSELVEPFKNAPAPVQSPDPAKYGIETKTEKLKDIMDTKNLNEVDNFLRKAFEFRNNPSLLGLVTIFAEKLAYSENRIFSETIEQAVDMHDLLVDAPKQGYIFTQAKFECYVGRLPKKPRQPVHKTAMEDCANTKEAGDVEKLRQKDYRYNPNNILDYLYFKVVRKHNIDTMTQVKIVLSKAMGLEDETLLYPKIRLKEKKQKVIDEELFALKARLDQVYLIWNTGWHRDHTAERFNALIDDCYQKYRDIQPENPGDPYIQHWVEPYLTPGMSYWDSIKASALYAKYSRRPEKANFVFKMAGRELARLKADSFPHTRAMVSEIRTNMKPKPIKAPIQYDEEDEEDDFENALKEPMLE
ncbi:RNA-directed RNA polymerase 2 [Clathrospora elynae]|uniref:RNA-dependent RNA polymerase n=1 Tax=Clathrospora elynae TaxID=706981 RepID=A0A6A5SJX3_9PLEO|nr:RNA-directed RNA polymerase 2 [Clathrospora elynae]